MVLCVEMMGMCEIMFARVVVFFSFGAGFGAFFSRMCRLIFLILVVCMMLFDVNVLFNSFCMCL